MLHWLAVLLRRRIFQNVIGRIMIPRPIVSVAATRSEYKMTLVEPEKVIFPLNRHLQENVPTAFKSLVLFFFQTAAYFKL